MVDERSIFVSELCVSHGIYDVLALIICDVVVPTFEQEECMGDEVTLIISQKGFIDVDVELEI